MENLHDKRKVYDKSQLLECEVKKNPIEQFRDWFMEAEEADAISEANAMAISTMAVSYTHLTLPTNREV